jgi:hypothetical protein
MTDAALDSQTSLAASHRILVWTGRVFSGLLVVFMLFDSVIKLLNMPFVAESCRQLGIPPEQAPFIGGLELALTVLYVYPRTAVLGAVLLTGLFGGAIASHVRIGDPWFSHILFGVYLGLFAWGGLYLRDARLRTLFPIRR